MQEWLRDRVKRIDPLVRVVTLDGPEMMSDLSEGLRSGLSLQML